MEELETQGGVVSVFVDIDFVLGLGCQFSVLDNAYQGFRLAVLVLYQLFHFYVWTASLVLSKSFCSSALLYLRSKKRAEQTLELFLTEDHYVKMNRLCRFSLRRKQKAVNELSLSQRIIGKLVSPTKSYLRSNIMALHNILNSNWIKSKWTTSEPVHKWQVCPETRRNDTHKLLACMIQVSIVSRGSHYAAISCAHNHWATCGTAQSGFTFHCLCQNIEQNRKRCVFSLNCEDFPGI